MKLLLIYFFLSSLASCSFIKRIPEKKNHRPSGVDLAFSEPLDTNAPQIAPNEETIRLGEHGGDIFVHEEKKMDEDLGKKRKKIRFGLSLGPGLYRTINYVSLLRYLEKENLAPGVITGTGFGAIIAAMYASGMTPEVIEWNFYKYFKEKKNTALYTEDWLEEVDTLLLEVFRNKNLRDTKKKMYITLYNEKTKKTHYFDKGNIHSLLLMNLKLGRNETSSRDKNKYSAAFEDEIFNAKLMRRHGVDFAIGADVLGDKFDFLNSNEFLIGVYGKAAGKIAKEKKEFDYFFSIPLREMRLDSVDNRSSYLLKSYEYIKKEAELLKKVIQLKRESNLDLELPTSF